MEFAAFSAAASIVAGSLEFLRPGPRFDCSVNRGLWHDPCQSVVAAAF
jgi:hypothetical protein